MVGVDYSRAAIALAEKITLQEGYQDSIQYQVLDILDHEQVKQLAGKFQVSLSYYLII